MKDRTNKIFAIYISNIDIFNYVGVNCISEKELLNRWPDLNLEDLFPLLKCNNSKYEIDFELFRSILNDLFENVLSGLLDIDCLKQYISIAFPNYTLQLFEEVESADHQSYRYLFETLSDKYNSLNEEFHSQRYYLQDVEAELAAKNHEIKKLKECSDEFNNSASAIMQFITDLLSNEIVLSNPVAVDQYGNQIVMSSDKIQEPNQSDISISPGIYGCSRPSWFSEIKIELNKENAALKVTNKTSNTFLNILKRNNELSKKTISANEKADEYDQCRKQEIMKLLFDNTLSNEEKYLKYILLTPGISKDFLKTLDGAADLGLNANIIIKLLEQPKETFNKEIIEAYISRAHKGTEYNFKQELAEELINGQWSIIAEINGKKEKFQLVPYEFITNLSKEFKNLYDSLKHAKENDFMTVSYGELEENNSLDNSLNNDTALEDEDNTADKAWESELEARFADFDKGVM